MAGDILFEESKYIVGGISHGRAAVVNAGSLGWR